MKKIATKGKYILKNKKIYPCNELFKWARWFETADRVIKQETLSNGYYVSTIFLGMDMNIFGEGEPILFETMVFDKLERGMGNDEYQKRYSTWEEAVQGHAQAKKEFENRELYTRVPLFFLANMVRSVRRLLKV